MRIENYIDLNDKLGVSGLFFAVGSFGVVDGKARYERKDEGEKTTFIYTDGKVRLVAEFEAQKNGVVVRRDRFYNVGAETTEIYSLLSRFSLTGNEYEVYTQYSGWQHESLGDWQRLLTQITSASEGIRTCDGAAPVMAFHDLYTERNTVFHLLPNAEWQMTARKFPRNDRERVIFECGFYDRGLRLSVMPGECIELPTVVFFTAESKTDLDAYKLHEWFLGEYPRRRLPILYNSWLYAFDEINVDELICQARACADMGIEAFMVDAGWFGKGKGWWNQVGDWEEKTENGPCGRLSELSEKVRELGMSFGLWFEPERVGPDTRALSEHPDFYIAGRFLDFSNPLAVDFIFGEISKAIDKYKVGWVKFDFNMTIPYDTSGNAFYRYMRGQREFIERLRKKYPQLYITNCAAGGGRMELGQATLFDDFWLSDNQGPTEGVRIVKDTIKRVPPSLIQRWNAAKYCEGFPAYHSESCGRMIHTTDESWGALVGIDDSFAEGFLVGGPMGFSCDVAAFPKKYKERFKGLISDYKKEREFYRTATARVLTDTSSVTVIEYANEDLSTCIIQIFTKTTYAQSLLLYPAVACEKSYCFGDTVRTGKDIFENGILVEEIEQNACKTVKLYTE